MKGLPRGPHLTRYFMYKRLAELGKTSPNRNGRVLSISRPRNVVEILGLTPSEVVPANYPEHSILSLKFSDESFDHVISDQVLEHVEGPPQDAIDECHRILKAGRHGAPYNLLHQSDPRGAGGLLALHAVRAEASSPRLGRKSSRSTVGAISRSGRRSAMVSATPRCRMPPGIRSTSSR